jgi:DNA-binding response OmpR family regulator
MAKILVVDDNELVRATTRTILQGAGHEVDAAGEGDAALRYVASTPPDLVLTDIVMPNKEGIGLILELRRTGYKGAIIAMSGGGKIGPSDLLTMARKLGADDCMPKPFHRADLIAKVAACLERGAD